MKMTLMQKARILWDILRAPRDMVQVDTDWGWSNDPKNPYLDQDAVEGVYETLENCLHAVWPLLRANEGAGVLAARGLVMGVLYSFTGDEDGQDQRGVAWELARLVGDYLPEDQDPMEMSGVKGTEILAVNEEETEIGVIHRVPGELMAFFDAGLTGNLEGAANVTEAVTDRLAQGAMARGAQPDHETAVHYFSINFLGSVLASLADKYAELEILAAEGASDEG